MIVPLLYRCSGRLAVSASRCALGALDLRQAVFLVAVVALDESLEVVAQSAALQLAMPELARRELVLGLFLVVVADEECVSKNVSQKYSRAQRESN